MPNLKYIDLYFCCSHSKYVDTKKNIFKKKLKTQQLNKTALYDQKKIYLFYNVYLFVSLFDIFNIKCMLLKDKFHIEFLKIDSFLFGLKISLHVPTSSQRYEHTTYFN